MPDQNLSISLKKFPTGCLCNAHKDVKAMGFEIKPLAPGTRVVGPARTVWTKPGQNAAIHRAVASAKPGEVLVVDAGGPNNFGPFGDILAFACQNAGISGLVIDGTIRDTQEIRKMGFPVFCRGANPAATKKKDLGRVNSPIGCGGVEVFPGDYIVADDDGVVVIPKNLISGVIDLAILVLERKEEIKTKLKAGKTTCEIFKIPK
jgi:4-hydroxy-4-methyl-2-oxoglutarate aldolase